MLVDCFWPQTDAVAGARSLQVAVHTLCCSLRGCGPGGSDKTVLFRHHQYLLNPALSIVQDVDAFRAAYELVMALLRQQHRWLEAPGQVPVVLRSQRLQKVGKTRGL